MSQFLPDGPYQTQPPSGVADITPTSPETTSADIALMQRVLSAAARNPNLIPADFMAYVLDWIQTQRLTIPIGQVFGFTQFTAKSDRVDAGESTTSTSYGDLTTAGPEIDGLSDGAYILFYGATMFQTSGGEALMSPSINSAAASDSIAAKTAASTDQSVMTAYTATLSSGANSVAMKYRASAGTSDFAARWLIAIKYANN